MSVEDSLRALARAAQEGSRRAVLMATVQGHPSSPSIGMNWINTSHGTVNVQAPSGRLTLSPDISGQVRSSPNTNVLGKTEAAASYFNLNLNITRSCRLRTFLDVQIVPTAGGGTAGTRTYNNFFVKQYLCTVTPSAIVETDSVVRSSNVQDDGAGNYFNSGVSLRRVWDTAITGPTTNYYIAFAVWKQFDKCGVTVASYSLVCDFVDTVL